MVSGIPTLQITKQTGLAKLSKVNEVINDRERNAKPHAFCNCFISSSYIHDPIKLFHVSFNLKPWHCIKSPRMILLKPRNSDSLSCFGPDLVAHPHSFFSFV